jgi:hypothetical protein
MAAVGLYSMGAMANFGRSNPTHPLVFIPIVLPAFVVYKLYP